VLGACLALSVRANPADGKDTPGDPGVRATNNENALRDALHQTIATGEANPGAPPIPILPPPATFQRTNVVNPVNPVNPAVTAPPAAVPTAPGPTVPGNPPAAAGAVAPQPGLPTPAPGNAAAAAQPANAAAEETIAPGTINFPNTDLAQVLQIYGELVNRTILRPTSLPAPTITLKTQTPLTKHEAIQAFDAVFALNGIATENIGDKFVKVVPMAQAGQEGAPISTNAEPQDLSELGPYTTHVVQLKYARPTEMVAVLQPFAKIPSAIFPIDSSMILVLHDFTENVKRMLEMIKKIDVSVPSEFISEVIPIKYAIASDIASALNSLSAGGGGSTVGGGGGTAGGARGGTRPGFGAGGVGASRFGGSGFGTPGYGGAYGAQPGATPFGTTTPGITPGATTTPGGGGTFTDRLRGIIQRASVAGEIQVIGQNKIIADERTNSLLVFASREDMRTIKDIINKLDVVLAQVLIEVVIVQVTLNNSRDLGISYLETQPHGIGNYFKGIGAINNGNGLRANAFQTIVTGTNNNGGGILPGGLSYLGTLDNDLQITLTAMAADSRTRILQRPRIQTSHAVPASIFVGESRPYPTSSYYGGGAFGGYSSIQQLQIGVRLEVTPLINPDGLVVMDIAQDIESAEGTVNIANVGDVPITSQKQATAKVAVRDRDTIILGGLIETSKTKSASGVPFLKDIPLLGYLFRASSDTDDRNELMVLIRPTVLPTPEVAALAAKSEKDKMPGVRRAERELMEDEAARMRAEEKREAQELKRP
jgi:general secretion pathway protein D